MITNTGISTTTLNATNINVSGMCSNCIHTETITYTGDGSVGSRQITVSFQPKIIFIQSESTNFGGWISTNSTYIFAHNQGGGSSLHFNGADSGTYTGSNYVDVGNLNNALTETNNLGVVYDMTILR